MNSDEKKTKDEMIKEIEKNCVVMSTEPYHYGMDDIQWRKFQKDLRKIMDICGKWIV